MSTRESQGETLVRRLQAATESGAAGWVRTGSPQVFALELSGGTVTLEGATTATSVDPTLRLFDEDGTELLVYRGCVLGVTGSPLLAPRAAVRALFAQVHERVHGTTGKVEAVISEL